MINKNTEKIMAAGSGYGGYMGRRRVRHMEEAGSNLSSKCTGHGN